VPPAFGRCATNMLGAADVVKPSRPAATGPIRRERRQSRPSRELKGAEITVLKTMKPELPTKAVKRTHAIAQTDSLLRESLLSWRSSASDGAASEAPGPPIHAHHRFSAGAQPAAARVDLCSALCNHAHTAYARQAGWLQPQRSSVMPFASLQCSLQYFPNSAFGGTVHRHDGCAH